jgi:hypothetical protein
MSIQAQLSFVAPGGGEASYSLKVDLPALPAPGDYIGVQTVDGDDPGYASFIVRRTWWHLVHSEGVTEFARAIVECEFARGHDDKDSHKEVCDICERRGKKPKEFDATVY